MPPRDTTDLFDLTGTSVLVTGGNGGIGLGIAHAVATAGASVAIWGRNEERTKTAVERLAAWSVTGMQVDVSDEKSVVDSFAETVEALGKVDAVFVNAGIGAGSTPFVETTTEEWGRIFGTNMDGAFWTLREAIGHMKPRRSGSLIVTSSIYGDRGLPMGAHYAATKAGVRALVRSIAVEYGPFGIRANAIAPGWVTSGMTSGFIDGDRFATNVKPRIPLGRWGKPEDMAGIAVYLASDASSWHSGDTITIDGGYLSS